MLFGSGGPEVFAWPETVDRYTFLIGVCVRLQLCVAVVHLSLQINSWKNPIYTLLNNYNEIPHLILLEILRIFPEELDTELIRLGSNRRNEIFSELCNCAGLMNDYLVSAPSPPSEKSINRSRWKRYRICQYLIFFISQKEVVTRDPSPVVLLKAFRCFSSWVAIGLATIPTVLDCELLPKAFQILTEPPVSGTHYVALMTPLLLLFFFCIQNLSLFSPRPERSIRHSNQHRVEAARRVRRSCMQFY